MKVSDIMGFKTHGKNYTQKRHFKSCSWAKQLHCVYQTPSIRSVNRKRFSQEIANMINLKWTFILFLLHVTAVLCVELFGLTL